MTKKGEGDPAFKGGPGGLDETRILLLKKALDTPAGVTYSADDNGDSDYVQVSFDGKDTDPPALQVHSAPPKGSRVTAGQTIAVTIRASELLLDGHKSWPSGVQAIQLTDNNGLVKVWDYGKPPQPCAVQNETWPYTVPDNPPPIVHLIVTTQDAFSNQAAETADFPTAAWYGTIKGQAQWNIYNDKVKLEFAFSVDANGVVKGKGHAKMTNAQAKNGSCLFTIKRTPDELDVAISGRRDGDWFNLQLENPVVASTVTSMCPGTGRSSTKQLAFFGVMVAGPSFKAPRVLAEDGATNSLDFQMPGRLITGTIEIHQNKKNSQ